MTHLFDAVKATFLLYMHASRQPCGHVRSLKSMLASAEVVKQAIASHMTPPHRTIKPLQLEFSPTCVHAEPGIKRC